ncbi:MAG: P-loop NTPase [Coriobacteriales bacterium]
MAENDKAPQGQEMTGSKTGHKYNIPNLKDMPDYAQLGPQSRVKKVIGIVSGKGGVGKSLVTSLLAVKANKEGMKTAILDSDITGPSIPRSFGITQHAGATVDGNLIPAESAGGIKVMSLNLLVQNETDPVIWRGPIISGIVTQFWSEVIWGDIDVMFVDMPPGTGDVALTVFQSLPIDGLIIVTSPQELVGMIVEKAINMAQHMNVPVLGIVENMSYIVCPDCGKKIALFGESHLKEIAERHGIANTATLPMDSNMAKACDTGKIEEYEQNWLDDLFDAVVR